MIRLLAVCTILLLVNAGAASAQKPSLSPRTPRRYVTAIRYDKSGDFPAPDGRFIARLTHTDADTKLLTIHSLADGKPSKKSLIVEEGDIENIQWVPRQPHTLLVGVNGIYNPNPRLALWRGGNTLQTLIADKKALRFGIKDVSANGRAVRYERRGESDFQNTVSTPLRSLSLSPFLSKNP